MILFFDTETTGKADFRMPPSDECQPDLVQLGLLLTEDDGTERATFCAIVRPDKPIPAEVAAIHGITTELANRCGISRLMAVSIWDRLARLAGTLVAHSVEFDLTVMQAAWCRHPETGGEGRYSAVHGRRPSFCTMRAATPICKIPHANPRKPDDWKFPKLAECVKLFFDEEHAGAHTALADVRACARVYFHLKKLEAEAAA